MLESLYLEPFVLSLVDLLYLLTFLWFFKNLTSQKHASCFLPLFSFLLFLVSRFWTTTVKIGFRVLKTSEIIQKHQDLLKTSVCACQKLGTRVVHGYHTRSCVVTRAPALFAFKMISNFRKCVLRVSKTLCACGFSWTRVRSPPLTRAGMADMRLYFASVSHTRTRAFSV
jgi:hypothetical protein